MRRSPAAHDAAKPSTVSLAVVALDHFYRRVGREDLRKAAPRALLADKGQQCGGRLRAGWQSKTEIAQGGVGA